MTDVWWGSCHAEKKVFVGRARFCRRYLRHAGEVSRCPGQSCQPGSRWQTQLTALCCVTNVSWHAPCSDSDNVVTRFVGRLIANQTPACLGWHGNKVLQWAEWHFYNVKRVCVNMSAAEKNVGNSVGRSNKLNCRWWLLRTLFKKFKRDFNDG